MRLARRITLPNPTRGKGCDIRAQEPGLWVRGISRWFKVAVGVRAKVIGEVTEGGE